ncbi:MAG TPA: hypothetical protein V6D29_21860 [Leptolyngbyaceae cyanobacterium]
MEIDSKKSGSWLKQLLNWSYWLIRLIDVRLALVVGLGAFLLTVGVDSNNYATAADLREASVQTINLAAPHLSHAASGHVESEPKQTSETTYLEFDPAIAHRLSQGALTRAVFTGSHLTRAHLFTQTANSVE